MKKRLNLLKVLILTTSIVLSFNSCKQKGTTSCCGVEPLPKAVVLKFKNLEYKKYVLANYLKGDSVITATRGNNYREPIGKAGYSPYWELSDDWLLVDWKWLNFPYEAGLTLLTNQTWEEFKWIDTPPFPQWPLSEPHIFQPVDKILYINIFHLQNYMNRKYSEALIGILLGKSISKQNSPNEMSNVADSCWTILQKDLSFVIVNGDLEKINEQKYCPY